MHLIEQGRTTDRSDNEVLLGRAIPKSVRGAIRQRIERLSAASTALLMRGIRAFSSAINEMRSSVDAQLFLELALLECIAAEEKPAASHVEAIPHVETAPRATAAPRKPETTTPAVETIRVAPAAETAQTGIEMLRAQWKQLIQDVNASNKPTAALLRSCHPQSVEDDIVRIRADHDLIRQRLEDPKHRDVMTTALNNLMKGKFTVHIFTAQVEQDINSDEDPLVKAAKKLGGKVRGE